MRDIAASPALKTCFFNRSYWPDLGATGQLLTELAEDLDPEERRRYLRAFEKRLYDEEVHYIMTFQWNRIVPHLSKVRGWTITPSHYLNNQLDTVWLAE